MCCDMTLTLKKHIKGLGDLSVYTHKSGARVFCVDNDDSDLVFSLCFDTPAHDDTGIPHILEHCVFCGSEAYPIKDPFNMLAQNTLYTYLNAITYPHKTLYPAASVSGDSLMIMAGVYCDAVFHPLVYKNKGIFLQEGGFFDGEKIRGSVYGEMSGFYDISENSTEQRLKKAFTPFHAAGVPEDIPKASFPALLDYHKKYYVPSNCTAYIYGNCGKEKYLDLLSDVFGKAHNAEKPPLYKTPLPDRIFVNGERTMALIPAAKTCDYVLVHAYDALCRALAAEGINAVFNTDGDTAYIKITGQSADELAKKAIGRIKSTNRPDFYIKNRDFGYKPRGLYYNILLMQAKFDPASLELDDIFSRLPDTKSLTDRILSLGVEYIGTKKPSATAYPVTDPAPLYSYQAAKDNDTDIFIPLPKPPCEDIVFDGQTAFTDNKNKDTVNITLDFVLDMPRGMLERAVSLLKMRRSALPFDAREFGDIGRPVFMMHLGFLAKDAQSCAARINKIFSAEASQPLPPTDPEFLTRYTALGAAEKSAFTLSRILGGSDTRDIADIQKYLFTKNAVYCAVCTDKSNFSAAKRVIASLELYPDTPRKAAAFIPDGTESIILTDNAVNTISLAFKAGGSPAERYALSVYLKNTYLWENIRCAGAYGCDCGLTPCGDIYMTSFKDINFESSIETMKAAFSHIQGQKFCGGDLHRLKLMCLNALLKPRTPKNANIYALERLFGARDISRGILPLTADGLISAAKNTEFISLCALKAKN